MKRRERFSPLRLFHPFVSFVYKYPLTSHSPNFCFLRHLSQKLYETKAIHENSDALHRSATLQIFRSSNVFPSDTGMFSELAVAEFFLPSVLSRVGNLPEFSAFLREREKMSHSTPPSSGAGLETGSAAPPTVSPPPPPAAARRAKRKAKPPWPRQTLPQHLP